MVARAWAVESKEVLARIQQGVEKGLVVIRARRTQRNAGCTVRPYWVRARNQVNLVLGVGRLGEEFLRQRPLGEHAARHKGWSLGAPALAWAKSSRHDGHDEAGARQ